MCWLLFYLADPAVDSVSWSQAWELLERMASNPESLETMQNALLKYSGKMTGDTADKDMLDSKLGALMHRMILVLFGHRNQFQWLNSFSLQTSISEFETSTPTYRKEKRQDMVTLLSSLTAFSVQFLQNSGTNRQFASLATLNKVYCSTMRKKTLFPLQFVNCR